MNRALFATLLSFVVVVPLRADEPAKPVAVPFDLLVTKHMVIQVRVNGKGPYRMIFDTGAPVSLISSKVAKAAGVLTGNAPKPLFNLFGPAEQSKVKTLEIGDLKARAVPVIVMDHPTVQLISTMLGPIEGIVGFPFFARYRMTLDYQAKEMTFVPNDYEPADILQVVMATLMTADKPAKKVLAPAGLWGLVLDKQANDEEAGVTIKAVLPGSPAAATGLQANDRLLTLDDRWTDTLIDCYTAAGYVKAGSEAKVVITRDGRQLELTVKPLSGL
jgi:Aspartyl protease/PDZ domain